MEKLSGEFSGHYLIEFRPIHAERGVKALFQSGYKFELKSKLSYVVNAYQMSLLKDLFVGEDREPYRIIQNIK